jgi:hypothetical protein
MAEQFDVLSVLGYRRQGELTLAEWWSSVRQTGDLEFGWLDPDDLLPVAWMAVRSLFRTVSRDSGLTISHAPDPAARPAIIPGEVSFVMPSCSDTSPSRRVKSPCHRLRLVDCRVSGSRRLQ